MLSLIWAPAKVGDGFTEGVTTGPLIDRNALKKVLEHVADAVAKGATVEAGGKPASQGGLFFEPT
ncbi:MAG: aldehyde dehydrogenase family protein, partial [Mesorhizobium sp.]